MNTASILSKSDISITKKLCVLVIMDGLGIKNSSLGNAVLQAKTPILDSLWSNCPGGLLSAAEESVGLSKGNPGNSEACHITIGTGHASTRSLPRINKAIKEGTFGTIPALTKLLEHVTKNRGRLHLLGILSSAGVHGHIQHLFELMKVCKAYGIDPYIHVILDGRDTGLNEGYAYMNLLMDKIRELGIGKIASICGRRFSMDRDEKWERTEVAYNAMVGNGLRKVVDPVKAVEEAYKAGENDQIFTPSTVVDKSGNPIGAVRDGDSIIFYNFREDRARQLTKAFILPEIPFFNRELNPETLNFFTMISYQEGLSANVLFPPTPIQESLSSLISKAGLSQLHISETEKFAHITYFFNGGEENPHKNEVFLKLASPDVFDYSEVPEMAAYSITEEVIKGIESDKYNFIIVNYANPDMLGHTGNLECAIKAVEITDECVGNVVKSAVAKGGFVIVSADHGCCETMINEVTGEVDTAHTINPVPVSLCDNMDSFVNNQDLVKVGTGEKAKIVGTIADLGVTVLKVLNIDASEDMTGRDLRAIIKS